MASPRSKSNRQSPQAPARPTAVLQRRGVERVNALLDAAEALLAEQGYEATTLKAIGDRAGIPTASVYHYFSDRGQVEVELAERYARELGEYVAAALNDREFRTIREAVDAIIDPYLNFCRKHPSFARLWWPARTTTLRDKGDEFDQAQAEGFWQLLLAHNLVDADTPFFVVQIAFEAGDRLFDVAFQVSPTGDDATIDEARRLVTAYLETYASKAPKRRAGKRAAPKRGG